MLFCFNSSRPVTPVQSTLCYFYRCSYELWVRVSSGSATILSIPHAPTPTAIAAEQAKADELLSTEEDNIATLVSAAVAESEKCHANKLQQMQKQQEKICYSNFGRIWQISKATLQQDGCLCSSA